MIKYTCIYCGELLHSNIILLEIKCHCGYPMEEKIWDKCERENKE